MIQNDYKRISEIERLNIPITEYLKGWCEMGRTRPVRSTYTKRTLLRTAKASKGVMFERQLERVASTNRNRHVRETVAF